MKQIKLRKVIIISAILLGLVVSLRDLYSLLWFRVVTAIYSSRSGIANELVNLPKDALFFFRNSSDHTPERTGIWTSTGSKDSEKEILSISQIYKEPFDASKKRLIFYANPTIGPDKTKIAFYIGIDNKEFDVKDKSDIPANLYVYDVISGKLTTLMKSVKLLRGYTQSPIWNSKSQFLLITIKQGEKNELFEVNLRGDKNNLDLISSGEFWPRFVNENTVFLNTSLPYDHFLASIDLRTFWPSVYNFNKFSTYLNKGIYLTKDGFVTTVSGDNYNRHPFKSNEINGLVKYYFNDGSVKTYLPPNNYIKTTKTANLRADLICGNLVFLIEENINPDKYGFDKNHDNDSYYIFSLDSQNLQKIPINERYYYYPKCDNKMQRIIQTTRNNILFYDIKNPIPPRIYNYAKALEIVGVSGNNFVYMNIAGFQDNYLVAEVNPMFDLNFFPKGTGLYVVDLETNKAVRFTYPTINDGQDQYIYYFK